MGGIGGGGLLICGRGTFACIFRKEGGTLGGCELPDGALIPGDGACMSLESSSGGGRGGVSADFPSIFFRVDGDGAGGLEE